MMSGQIILTLMAQVTIKAESQNAKYQYNQHKLIKKTFKYFDGIEIDISKDSGQIPLIIFYPSGENSGGILKIFKSELIEEIIIKKKNRKII